MQSVYYIDSDVHKKSTGYRGKDASGQIHAERTIPATRFDLGRWMKTLNSLRTGLYIVKE